ncbi:MAG: AMP-binding protein, partial [Paracoccaceae bacterium]
MYDSNHLAGRLRAASITADTAPFLYNHATGLTDRYCDTFAKAEKMAAALVALGVHPGDRVAVQAPKTVAMVELYLGVVLAGAVFLPLNTAYTGAELRYFLEDAAPRVLVCDPSRAPALREIAAECSVAHVVTIAADETGSLPDLRDAQPAGFDAVPRRG